jgi:hypothetical protein
MGSKSFSALNEEEIDYVRSWEKQVYLDVKNAVDRAILGLGNKTVFEIVLPHKCSYS